ncbi:hypothetical protein ABB37_09101 [Leptomonas pyrrhocoris]|uniref:Uncharacterized protein n=1 Tax=Leptomonas pyrrhocoris TaxID=157538 RepID=A0A0M9FRA1_LEPPY|nr:hypothetical protein ABB37_09101 [Leptomonas pyrrhocoris]XP_015652836.1 hypothetical protein ABB37_09101 [Leptomonas pyrrhocoris]KPA74396.1 hypothetical protein ABB37_09101 [Leptomonas pyrrhocoris]KPA74397.1 hypothetical protein ABB37_09101 [Leptomonas pyrrhocoris]|eukprot:XP_015652835.1 hypothetical protein ABB37_09101 [Leptomonas pyrrhocoris]
MLSHIRTASIFRRHHREHRASAPVEAAMPASATTTTGSTSSAATYPHADPCYNYFELFPEEVGAVGNVEVVDAEEAYLWKLVGRRVSQAAAEAEGGCVKVTLAGSEEAPLYYSITDSDDEVYGRAAYLPRPAARVPCMLKEEPSVFTESCSCDACSEEDENDCSSACSSPCADSMSLRCTYPVNCGSS